MRKLQQGCIPAALLLLSGFGSGCGVLFGNVKPVDEKSEQYGIADLSKENPEEWARLDSQSPAPGASVEGSKGETSTPSEVGDCAYQSRKTASIVSLNSACRAGLESEHRDLKSFTNDLFLGISDVAFRNEKMLTIQGTPALETTLKGRLSGEDMMLRTVVLRRKQCLYDLMYVSRPDRFAENEADFAHFVESLRLR